VTLEERFWSKVDRSGGPEACHPWMAACSSNGYGSFDHRGAHRVALEIKLGRPLAPGMFACHTCDNPPCCNPAHLFEGTHQANVDDRHSKGRDATGEGNGALTKPWTRARGERHGRHTKPESNPIGTRNGRARLIEDDVRQIRRLFHEGRTQASIAESFGVSIGTVKHITARRTWQQVS
jgi:hypothetical protein